MPSAGVHPIALLSVCELCTRAQLRQDTTPVVGGLYGTVVNDFIEIWYAFEIRREGSGIDTKFLIDKDGLLKTTNPAMQLLGWFTTQMGAENMDSWAYSIHAQVESVVPNPLLCTFSVPIPQDSTEFPVRAFKLDEAGIIEIPVEFSLDRPEETAVNDVMTMRSKSKGAVSDQLAKQTNAMILLHERLVVLRDYLQKALDGDNVDQAVVAKIVTAVDLLVRENDVLHTQESEHTEVGVITEVLAAVILNCDKKLLQNADKF